MREVTAAVRDHIEQKTASAVDSLWEKGQRAMQNLQQQQLDRTALLQSQLLQCSDAHQQLQRENAMLRSGLEALMKHLTLVFGAPPHMPRMPHGAPPGMPPGMPPPCTAMAPETNVSPTPQTEQSTAAFSQTGADAPAPSARAAAEPSVEDFHTPAGSPLRAVLSAAEELGAGPSPTPGLSAIPGFPIESSSSGGTGSLSPGSSASALTSTPSAAVGAGHQAQVPSFSLTLRRADNVPLGLDVAGDSDSDTLLVEGIRLGGAVEAWNRQCHGDSREIRRGDRIIMINGSKDAESMRDECLNKHLLRMSVVRGPPAEHGAAARAPTSAAVSAAANSGGSLRAEADEFVPQAQPWLPTTTC